MSYRRTLLAVVPPAVVTLLAPLLWYVTAVSSVILTMAVIYVSALACWAVIALLHGSWRSAAVYTLPFILAVILRFSGTPYVFLQGAGFHAKISPAALYVQKCMPKTFSEDGRQQAVGLCEIMNRTWSDVSDYIVYDTSGESVRPAEMRTQQWKNAMRSLPNGRILSEFDLVATPLCGSFYAIHVTLQDADRSAGLDRSPESIGTTGSLWAFIQNSPYVGP
jgi:energy-coupling factor transporter transmembrane protein EcfT